MGDPPRSSGLEAADPDGTVYGESRTKPILKQRRITLPSFMIELREGSPVGEYEIQGQIGEGGMGTVYNAIHPLIGKRVAIKVLKPELCSNQVSIDRFVHEAQAINKIGHPNIVDVFALGELPDGRAYFVMEWLRGEDLKVRLKRGPMMVLDACDILDGIARALDAAHAKDIVHRDLKPDNVFLHQIDSGPLQVKLLDFGIAKLITKGDKEQTATGNILGTPRYISPEQARGIDVDHRSDIYSLGVMAYEMLAGRPPFQGETAMDLVVKHLGEPAPALSQFARVPKALEQCVMRMLEKDPARRPSLSEVRTILVDPSRRMTPLPRHLARASSRRRWPLVAGGVAIAAVLGVIGWQVTKSPAASAPVALPVAAPSPVVAAPVATVARGVLGIEISGAKDVEILVDGKQLGRGTLVKVPVDAGDHIIEVRPPGQPAIVKEVTVGQGQDKSVAIIVAQPARPVGAKPSKPAKSGKPAAKVVDDPDALMKPKGHR